MDIFAGQDGLVKVTMTFDRNAFCDGLTDNGSVELTVIGFLRNGQLFYGTDTIRVIGNVFEGLAAFSSYWLQADCNDPDWCSGLDLDRESQVNFKDFSIMALNWFDN